MPKAKNKPAPQGQSLIVTVMLWPLIVKGIINDTLLTYRDNMVEGPLAVYAPGHEDEAIHFEVVSIFKAGSGYLPNGYPEEWRVRGRNSGANCLRVKRLESGEVPVPTETVPTDAEGEE